ncbi:MAG TPA: DUF6491 family protein [Woeseiaceae bacterium]|nr:DUF6491 family protein [Woeseiaceae bacterium]
MRKPLLAILFLSITVGCSTTDEREAVARGDVDYSGSDCILIRTIRDYRELDDRNLLIYGPGDRAYYVTLFRPSFELRSSFQMGFSSRDDQLCPFGGDAIVVGSMQREEIGIQSITRVTEEQEEQLLVRYGKKDPAGQQAPAPKDVKGAEVEELG